MQKIAVAMATRVQTATTLIRLIARMIALHYLHQQKHHHQQNY